MKINQIVKNVFVVMIPLLISSCSNEGRESSLSKASDSYIDAWCKKYNNIVTAPIFPSPASRASEENPSEELVALNFEFPEDASDFEKDLVKYISNLNDIIALQDLTAVDVTAVPVEEASENSLVISETKLKEAFNPIVVSARNYLLEQDITESELEQIVQETGATDEDLVLTAMVLLEQDLKKQQVAKLKSKQPTFSLLATPANAISNRDFRYVTECAIGAALCDISAFAATSVAKTWSMAVVRRVITNIAAKALGPAGAIIFGVSFGVCLYNKYHSSSSGGCSYETNVPGNIHSDIRDRYGKFKH